MVTEYHTTSKNILDKKIREFVIMNMRVVELAFKLVVK
jgi:hypothetical protein